MLRVVVVGGTTLPVRCVELLRDEGHRVEAVATTDPDVRAWAETVGVLCLDADDDLANALGGIEFDYLFSLNNLQYLPGKVIALARRSAVNFHDGPLPDYAGLNAPSWAILNGESEWAISWHVMTDRVDEGDVLLRVPVEILPDDSSLTLNTRCYEAAIESFPRLVRQLVAIGPEGEAQDLSKQRLFARNERPPGACVLSWSRPADELERLARALDFGTYVNALGLPKLLLGAEALVVGRLDVLGTASTEAAGVVTDIDDRRVVIATGTEDVALGELQRQDGRPVSPADLRGARSVLPGQALRVPSPDEFDRLTALHQENAAAEQFWASRLAALSPLSLSALAETNALPEARASSSQNVPPESLDAIAKLFPETPRGDLVVALLTAFLGRLGGQSVYDVAYADADVQSRTSLEKAVFVTHVPLHAQFDPELTGRQALASVLEELSLLRDHGTHLRDLVARTRGTTHDADSISIAIRQRLPAQAVLESAGSAALALLVEADGGGMDWSYASGLLDADAMYAMQSEFEAFSTALAADPATPFTELPLLGRAELDRILVEWNTTSVEFPREACVHELIEARARRRPNALAITCRGVELTYAELDRRSNQLANRLRQLGVGPGHRVGVCMDRSAELIVGLLAILKAGGAYVPLDPAYPADRVSFMVYDSGPTAILAHADVAARLLPHARGVLVLDDLSDFESESSEPIGRTAQPKDPAYVIYTSGSTGTPKGVVVAHRNVVSFFEGMDEALGDGAPGPFLAVTSISFDISVLELFWTLSRGFAVVVYAGDDKSPATRRAGASRALDFSLFFFASAGAEEADDRYRLLMESARFADKSGFSAVWTPERHFHAFGGLFPNPSVTSAMLAAITERIQIRAGSVVSPLHNPIRIAEEWSLVDNFSRGRVGISFAAGWQPDDFVLAPENFADRKDLMLRQIDVVRRLWRGESVPVPGPRGADVPVRILPRPVQNELPTWITAAGNPETFALAGENGFGILTHLLGQSIAELGEKIGVYRNARSRAGLDPEGGHVVVMLHTFVGTDENAVREAVREPLKEYLRSSVGLIQRAAWSFPTFKQATTTADGGFSLDHLSEGDLEDVLDFSFERYYETSGLLGTPDKCLALVHEMRTIGVDEIACLIDFHADVDAVLDHLPQLETVRKRSVQAASAHSDESIPGLIERYGVTHMQCTPSMAAMLVQSPDGAGALGSLRQLLIGGEALPPSLAATLVKLVPGQITNMYGPTETTVWSSTHRLDGYAGGPVPIGRPIANTQLYILDEARNPVPVGTPGELYIGGEGVALGYLDRPELTAERFLPDSFGGAPEARLYRTGDLVRYRPDGIVEFLGRVDHQVKIRGYRIEIGEVEAELARHDAVRETVVVAAGDGMEGTQSLVAYVVSREGAGPTGDELRRHLRSRLPEFMVPSSFELLPALPRTPNGKVDRAALPAAGASSATRDGDWVAPRGKLEAALVEIWERELGVQPVGVEDDFFELGGHSLLAVRVFTQIDGKFGVRLPLATLFRAPTVERLAAVLRTEAPHLADLELPVAPPPAQPSARALVPIQTRGAKRPLFFVHAHSGHVMFYAALARHLGPEQPFYALQARGVDGEEEPLERFEDMAAAYLPEIRTVQAKGPYRLGGYCMGGVIALEIAQQLRARGENVELIAMLDSFHPRYRPFLPTPIYNAIHFVRLIGNVHIPAMARLPRDERARYFRTRGVRALSELTRQVTAPVRRLLGRATESADPLVKTLAAHQRAFDRYEPRPYDGPVALFRARRQPTGLRPEALLGWTGVVTGMDAVEIPTYFQCGIFEPTVQALAQELKRRVERIDHAATDPAARSNGALPLPEGAAVSGVASRGRRRR